MCKSENCGGIKGMSIDARSFRYTIDTLAVIYIVGLAL